MPGMGGLIIQKHLKKLKLYVNVFVKSYRIDKLDLHE